VEYIATPFQFSCGFEKGFWLAWARSNRTRKNTNLLTERMVYQVAGVVMGLSPQVADDDGFICEFPGMTVD
jgi:hypothetical protein